MSIATAPTHPAGPITAASWGTHAAHMADHFIARARHASDVEQDLIAEAQHIRAARFWMREMGATFSPSWAMPHQTI